MPRVRELSFSLPKFGQKDKAPDQTRSDVLAEAVTHEERRAAFEDYVESPEFDADCGKAAELLLDGDRDGLVEQANEDVPERAAARVAEIHAGH